MANEQAVKKETENLTEDQIQQAVKDALNQSPSSEESHADVISINDGSKQSAKPIEAPKNEPTLTMLMDIPLSLAVELGRTRIKIADLLKLGQGSVLELNKLSGESLDIIVNDKMLARGEVVVVNEKFGVRITEIISQSERVEQLR